MAKDGKAEEIEKNVREHPFAGVLAALLQIAEGPAAADLISAECLQATRSCPEILDWI
jgi:hypothetical protein